MKTETKTQNRTGVVIDPRYADHCMGQDQLECPRRVAVVRAVLDEPDLRGRFTEIAARRAEKGELLRVHAAEYIRRLEETEGKGSVYLDPDTSTSPLSHQTALLASGGLCAAIQQVHEGRLDNAFALVRPPGHHAERSAAKGFCLYNNVAVGAGFARHVLGLARILIVDWDLHHGNGTQHCFENDPSVLFFSTHRSFFYPGGGGWRELGKDGGRGFSVNIPLLPGWGDGEYLTLFERVLKPIALEFEPDLILVSAGFDIHFADPLGGMRVTPKGFAAMTRSILDLAHICCGGKVVLSLEGGYDLNALGDSVREVLKELAGLQFTAKEAVMDTGDKTKTDYVLWKARRVHGKYWKSLGAPPAGSADADISLRDRIRYGWAQLAAYLKT
jgi:acetoin utilization deacetylase AcuC-like enzyme